MRLWENYEQHFRDLCKAGALPGPKRGMRNLNTKRGMRNFNIRALSGPQNWNPSSHQNTV